VQERHFAVGLSGHMPPEKGGLMIQLVTSVRHFFDPGLIDVFD
jgi:hypothetical protein